MCIPLKDELAAERRLQSLLYSTPKERGRSAYAEVVSIIRVSQSKEVPLNMCCPVTRCSPS